MEQNTVFYLENLTIQLTKEELSSQSSVYLPPPPKRKNKNKKNNKKYTNTSILKTREHIILVQTFVLVMSKNFFVKE